MNTQILKKSPEDGVAVPAPESLPFDSPLRETPAAEAWCAPKSAGPAAESHTEKPREVKQDADIES